MRTTRVQVTGDRFHPAMPEGAVYVGRSGPYLKQHELRNRHPVTEPGKKPKPCKEPGCGGALHCRDEAVQLYRRDLLLRADLDSQLPPLQGRMLACRCAPELACHVDVLIWLLG